MRATLRLETLCNVDLDSKSEGFPKFSTFNSFYTMGPSIDFPELKTKENVKFTRLALLFS